MEFAVQIQIFRILCYEDILRTIYVTCLMVFDFDATEMFSSWRFLIFVLITLRVSILENTLKKFFFEIQRRRFIVLFVKYKFDIEINQAAYAEWFK
jgi:hypothetical protein